MPTNNFVFNEISARDYGIDVLDVREEEATYRDAEGVPVPHRTGELYNDNGRYANVIRVYTCAITKNALTYLKAFNAKLLSFVGNYRLEDTFDMDISYMMGRYMGAITPRISRSGDLITVEFSFNCAPQKYLESGDDVALRVDGTSQDIQTLGIGNDIFNEATKEYFAELEAIENVEFYLTLNDFYEVVKTSDFASNNRYLTFFLPKSFPHDKAHCLFTVVDANVGFQTMLADPPYAAVDINGSRGIKQLLWNKNGKKYFTYNMFSTLAELAFINRYRWVISNRLYGDDMADATIYASNAPDVGTLTPPSTVMEYTPLIHIKVSGAVSGTVLYLGTDSVTLNTPANIGTGTDAVALTDIYIDCETMYCYSTINNGPYNLNENVILDGEFKYSADAPLKVCTNSLIDYVEITPRWWTL